MESRLQELTEKLYKEGVEKANNEASSIIAKAKAEAEQIIDNAKKQALVVKQNSEKDAEQLATRIKSEIKMAGDQAVSILKQEIVDLLSKNALGASIKDAVSSKDLLVSVIKEIISKWDMSKPMDLDVILPEKLKGDLEKAFKTEGSALLSKGSELKFENRMNGGFKIAPKDGSFVLSFTDEDFIKFFQSFLRPKAKEILFPGA
ncbi:MAG: hypothetical protein A2015_16795 [Spirochaetes bacterium GWF1_31_7]|nr:MAG: hypothetical protein A2Y30_14160 [Spirochaetes bacterium GWE1_32_154]OHD50101.1 MAG: hypothetical protein A2Y29_12205 [Spirochaetes bacterium GWE2_31_10]OHD52414.1 MAG: hypothetical protein A2015_16795 [Spirochaetes bacterium GWF1_31_7]OHD73788.1 MAG: hypothetical protein A2355_10705 [Spirochaetes bacterium RIFOXYB1_FULL_32_8]HBD96058.1 V-type ATP synthase subunit E [Spirochaetia bacterium]